MSRAYFTIAPHAPHQLSPVPATASPARPPGWTSLEPEVARVFAAIRDCARIAWWDGSSVGLRLNGFLGLFEAYPVPPRRRERA